MAQPTKWVPAIHNYMKHGTCTNVTSINLANGKCLPVFLEVKIKYIYEYYNNIIIILYNMLFIIRPCKLNV